MHCDLVTLTYFSCSTDFEINICAIVHFFAAVIAVSLKPSIGIVLIVVFKHAL